MIDVRYPNEKKRENSISLICEQTKLKKKSVFTFLYDSYKEIGIKVIFKNSVLTYLLSIVIYIFGLAFLLTIFDGSYDDEKIFADVLSVFFFASPVVTQLSELLYYAYESPSGMFEYRNSYKYTAYQMSLLKMPLFSVMTMIVNCVFAVVWCLANGISNVLAPIGLIACSVFIYSLINVSFYTRFKRIGFVLTAVLWFFMNCILIILDPKIKIVLFVGIPFTMHALIAVVSIFMFVKIVEKSYFKPICLITE